MAFEVINPANGKLVRRYPAASSDQIEAALTRAAKAFPAWRDRPSTEKASLLQTVGDLFESKAKALAILMAEEMGKPIAQGVAEAEKCAWGCRYYAESSEEILRRSPRESDGRQAYVRYDPLGPILAIMPWNFPLWQVMRFVAPNLMAGNVGLLKHASNVPGCALAIEEILHEAGCPDGVFQSLLISAKTCGEMIGDRRIRGVTLTGSTAAGRQVASLAGKHLKPAVLELGGSDPFIVFADADIGKAARTGVTARCLNSGQSCIAAKRFFVEIAAFDSFVEAFVEEMKAQRMGDPQLEETQIGPQARTDLRDELADQVRRSVEKGAKVLCGGKVPGEPGAWYPPTALVELTREMPVLDEETFGPVAAIVPFDSEQDALTQANDTVYGLGASLWTGDEERAERMTAALEAGNVFVNGLVKSDPRIPFGGVKDSGYGRELSREGLREFVNFKTVWMA